MKHHIAIFVSGSGTNCENIIRYFANNPEIDVTLVVSNKADAYALVRAELLNVPTAIMPKSDFNNEQLLMPLLQKHHCDFIVLAGFLLMVPDFLLRSFNGRIVNIHPSLLPKYGGKGMWGHHVHEAVKAAGETETGITIHYVSEICDGGEIIAQFRTPLSPTDTPDDIAAKVHVLEQEHFPAVIEEVIRGL
ncbi:MAG: phosphoribosylglycinamide formyltransferase [Prevotella sp.]|nr:phosphoribosylglycinamide formyltransferase [Prevotella sp.]